MCLILIAYHLVPGYPLLIAANRDEFYDRPASPLDFWAEHPDVAGGVDKQAGGTWLGITRRGRFAAITNYRDPRIVDPGAPSRGGLVRDYLTGNLTPKAYLNALAHDAPRYNGFNLIAGDRSALLYFSNMEGKVRAVPPGLHGISNHLLNTPWPKVTRGKKNLARVLENTGQPSCEAIFAVMRDTTCPPDESLPDTGVGLAWERMLAPMFIQADGYGTRNTSVILMDKRGQVSFGERTFDPDGRGGLTETDKRLSFNLMDDSR